MQKNKFLMWIGLVGFVALAAIAAIWASSTRQAEKSAPENISPSQNTNSENNDNSNNTEGILEEEVEVSAEVQLPPAPNPPLNSKTSAEPISPPPAEQPINMMVEINNFAFGPSELRVKQGTTVVWTNKDSASHTVTSDSGTELNSELFGKEQTFTYIFNTKGEFSYFCKPHPWMKGKIIVE